MSSNLRANISLTTNILLVVGTFLLVLNLAPINRKAKIEQLCTEYNYLRGHKDHRYREYSNFDKEIQNKRDKRFIYLDKKITRLINLPLYKTRKNKLLGDAYNFCELYNHEFFNIKKYDYNIFYDPSNSDRKYWVE